MLPLSNCYTNCKKIKIYKVSVWCRAANEQIIQLASSHGLTGSVSQITPKKVCSHRRVTHINLSEEKKKKRIEFPATNTHTNNSGTSYLWKDSWQNSSDLWWREKKKKATATSQTAGRYKDVSHRRAWHIRMTATSSLVLSERGKKKTPPKKNSPYEPSLPTLIKNPDDERDAERVWRRMWEPYPSCGVSDTNASG